MCGILSQPVDFTTGLGPDPPLPLEAVIFLLRVGINPTLLSGLQCLKYGTCGMRCIHRYVTALKMITTQAV